jgi:starvation-inducible outer membrane lipoprotein
MVGRAVKQAFIGALLTSVLMGLVGCTSLPPKIEPTPEPTKHRKVVRTTPPTKIVKRKKVIVKKVIVPAEEAPEKPPVIPALGGGGGGGGGGHSW